MTEVQNPCSDVGEDVSRDQIRLRLDCIWRDEELLLLLCEAICSYYLFAVLLTDNMWPPSHFRLNSGTSLRIDKLNYSGGWKSCCPVYVFYGNKPPYKKC